MGLHQALTRSRIHQRQGNMAIEFSSEEEWRKAVTRRPISCGLAGVLLALSTLLICGVLSVGLFWRATGSPNYLGALPVIALGFLYFWIATPLFWRLELRLKPERSRELPANAVDSSPTPDPVAQQSLAEAPSSSEPQARMPPEEQAAPAAPTQPLQRPSFNELQLGPIPDDDPAPLEALLAQAEQSMVRKPWRSRTLGAATVLAGWLFVALAFAPLVSEEESNWLLTALTAAGAFFMLGTGRRLGQPTALETVRRDRRQPVVLLRSFSRDGAAKELFGIDDRPNSGLPLLDFFYMMFGLRPAAFELEMVRTLRRHGPVIAIGQPGERLTHEGASRVHVGDEMWRDLAYSMIRNANLILWQAGEDGASEGLYWELAVAVKHKEPHSMVLLVPNPWLRPKQFEDFRQKANPLLPVPIPATHQDANLIRFGLGWQPSFSSIHYYPPLLQPLLPSSVNMRETLRGLGLWVEPRAPWAWTSLWIGTLAFVLVIMSAAIVTPLGAWERDKFNEAMRQYDVLQDQQAPLADRLQAASHLAAAAHSNQRDEDSHRWCGSNALKLHAWRFGNHWCGLWRQAIASEIPGLSDRVARELPSLPLENVASLTRPMESLLQTPIEGLDQHRIEQIASDAEARSLDGAWILSSVWERGEEENGRDTGAWQAAETLGPALGLKAPIILQSTLVHHSSPVDSWPPELRARIAGTIVVKMRPSLAEYKYQFMDRAHHYVYGLSIQAQIQSETGLPQGTYEATCIEKEPDELSLEAFLSQRKHIDQMVGACIRKLQRRQEAQRPFSVKATPTMHPPEPASEARAARRWRAAPASSNVQPLAPAPVPRLP